MNAGVVGENDRCPRPRSAVPFSSWPRSRPSGSASAGVAPCVPPRPRPPRTVKPSPNSWRRSTPPSPQAGDAPRVGRGPRRRRRTHPQSRPQRPPAPLPTHRRACRRARGPWTSTTRPPSSSTVSLALARASPPASWPTATRRAPLAHSKGSNGSAGLAPPSPRSCRLLWSFRGAPLRGDAEWGAVTDYCRRLILDTRVL